ncbi:MAG: energy transducer TonB [candidate division KSB1 bacterium]|nr:energy transducer TonB [candidate division KSB1 bacterium]MDZ7406909.1 energy transducer TonB [candidate division KSB1 bacterium]
MKLVTKIYHHWHRNASIFVKIFNHLKKLRQTDFGLMSRGEAIDWIREDGKVETAKLQKGSGTDNGFDEAALQAATQFEFYPAMKNGKPVAVWVSIP